MSYKRTLINVDGILYKKLDVGALAQTLLACVRDLPNKSAEVLASECRAEVTTVRICLKEMSDSGIIQRAKVTNPRLPLKKRGGGRKKIFVYWEATS